MIYDFRIGRGAQYPIAFLGGTSEDGKERCWQGMLVKIASKDSEAVVNALIKHAGKLPQEQYKSLTWDRGTEMAGYKRFTVATDI
ncbi:hypothetical protein CBM2626_U40024 [Cupriavidus taiwanensis]|uniref:Uncharacterized protein n=1 Tax=Cupriavidus taiwanensis TaxID=164546 RepID=A0A375FKD0_9BURK|nr:hypothetical protein CBM2614_U40024 [Cupriavidus taiwanensis]SOZ73896.1 hypothetical protein CBM2615_U30021 [Cupriavidus taiwanensis]SOZ75354.1 hypothetical protein CBM2613_U30021 [Cupriavidus taiwanensis]SPA03886.1 hypothetical protein CBM2626_U40024 [Cupriavidus taiwanensis]SPA12911.1 hypothetical protein CBM2625_U60016 [Cupriavidus taiwanensis]